MPDFDLSQLKPGDVLLYRPVDWIGWLIAIKTWTKVSHVEIYSGNKMSIASRDGLGVNRYSFREKKLAAVLRPNQPFSFEKMNDYFESVRGQKYDWRALLDFLMLSRNGDPGKQICSEFASNATCAGGLKTIATHWPADRTAPANFLAMPCFDLIWEDGDLF